MLRLLSQRVKNYIIKASSHKGHFKAKTEKAGGAAAAQSPSSEQHGLQAPHPQGATQMRAWQLCLTA